MAYKVYEIVLEQTLKAIIESTLSATQKGQSTWDHE